MRPACCAILHPFHRLEPREQPFAELGVPIPHVDPEPGTTCFRYATHLVRLETGALTPACLHHAIQHERSVAGVKKNRYGEPSRLRARRLRWAEPGLDFAQDAEYRARLVFENAIARILEAGAQQVLSARPGLPLLDRITRVSP